MPTLPTMPTRGLSREHPSPILIPPTPDLEPSESSTSFWSGKISIFVAGMAIGSILDPLTLMVVFILGMLMDNRPLPEPLGQTPQQLLFKSLAGLVHLGSRLASIERPKKPSH